MIDIEGNKYLSKAKERSKKHLWYLWSTVCRLYNIIAVKEVR